MTNGIKWSRLVLRHYHSLCLESMKKLMINLSCKMNLQLLENEAWVHNYSTAESGG